MYRTLLMIRWVLVPCLIFTAALSQAADVFEDFQKLKIPRTPSAPPPLLPKSPPQVPQCERYFLCEGKKIESSYSNVGWNSARLRPLFEGLPGAIQELETYHENQRKIQSAAYMGTAGLIVMIAGIMLRNPVDETGALRPAGFIALGGLGLSANSLVYGLSMVKANEAHLDKAIEIHNSAHPDRPITVQFTAPLNF